MISQELFSEVLGYRVKWIQDNLDDDNNILYDTSVYTNIKLNIYELAHKCKEWAWIKHKEAINSLLTKDGWFATSTTYYELSMDGFEADTEPEAVFKACQWILDNKKDR